MAIGSKRHSTLTGDDVGSVIWQTVLTEAARTALSLELEDNGKIVYQSNTKELWLLTDYSTPAWANLGQYVNGASPRHFGPGILSGGGITDDGDGTITVPFNT